MLSGSGADVLTGGAINTYSLGVAGGQTDNAIDTVNDSGSILTVAGNGGITGFNVINQFSKGQDVLNFTPAMGAVRTVVTGTFANGVFTPGTATTDNDVLVYGEAGTTGGSPTANSAWCWSAWAQAAWSPMWTRTARQQAMG